MKENNKTSSTGSPRRDYKLFYIFGIVVALSILLYSLNINQEKKFEKNKISTNGIVKKMVLDTYKAEYASYERYLLEYEYHVENKNLSKLFEIKTSDLSSYFNEIPKRGDTILIAFNALAPLDSRPIKND